MLPTGNSQPVAHLFDNQWIVPWKIDAVLDSSAAVALYRPSRRIADNRSIFAAQQQPFDLKNRSLVLKGDDYITQGAIKIQADHMIISQDRAQQCIEVYGSKQTPIELVVLPALFTPHHTIDPHHNSTTLR